MDKVRSALALSWRDWRDLFQAWVLLLLADLGLRVLSFRPLQRLALRGWKEMGEGRGGGAPAVADRCWRLVDIAARCHLHSMTCLPQALTLQWLLGRRGIATELRIGVSRDSGNLAAHAWLEHAGRPIGEAREIASRFAPLVTAEMDG